MKRTIARLIEAPLAEAILRGQLESGSTAELVVNGGQIQVRISSGTGSVTAAE
jgi:ATP-dependent Clp protease ATP-binding subunit ClpC